MRTEDIFVMRKDFPMLSTTAYFLFVFILFRLEGSRLVDDDGNKFITLTGKNDPTDCLGFTKGQYRKAKKELIDNNLIQSVRSGFGQSNRIYVSTVGHFCTRLQIQSTVFAVDCKTDHQLVTKQTISSAENAPTALYIERPIERPKRKTKQRTAPPPSSRSTKDDEYVNPFTALLEEERRKNGKRTDDSSS